MFQWYVKKIAIFLHVVVDNYIMSHKHVKDVAVKYHIITTFFFFCCVKMSRKCVGNVAKKIVS